MRFHEEGNSEQECDDSTTSPMDETATTNEHSPMTVHVSPRTSHTMMKTSGREVSQIHY